MPKFITRLSTEYTPIQRLGLGALLLLVSVALLFWLGLLTIPDFMSKSGFLALHSAGELFAVVVALLIFTTAYHALDRRQSPGTVLMACAFLGAGTLDFLHTLSYPGMELFFTPNTTHKSIVLWLGARLLAALGILALVWPPLNTPGRQLDRGLALAITLAITAFCGYVGVFQPQWFPPTHIEGHGLTPIKIGLEWLVIFLNLIALFFIIRHPERFSRSLRNFLAPALLVLAASGLFFASYQHATDSINLLGHFYKVLGYLLIYRAIFVENVHQPYQQLHEAQRELAQLSYALDQVAEAVYLIDHQGRFRYVNREAARFLGHNREELLACGVEDVDPDFPMARWPQHWQELRAKGSLLFEGRHRDHQGRFLPVEINANYFEYEGEGYNLALVRDISERKRIEEERSRLYNNLQEAQRIAHLGSWSWNIAAGTLFWSDEVYRIFGVAPNEFGASYEAFLQYIHPEDREAVEAAVNAALADPRKGYSIEHRVVRRDGGTRWVHEQAEVVRNEAGEPIKMVGTVLDVSERRQAEARELQADKMGALGLMAGGIAHDFNNILTPIMMHTQMALREAGKESPLAHSLSQVNKAAERAAALVRQILDFSRQGRHEPMLIKLSMVVKEATKFLESVTPANIKLNCRINTNRDNLAADPTQILQVVMNLCLNSIHAIGEKEGLLLIELDESRDLPVTGGGSDWLAPPPADDRFIPLNQNSREPEKGRWLKLTVRDNGSGIIPEHLPRLFDPFFTTKEKGEGTGMGLPVVHGVVSRHGGRVRVESTPGRGTTFEIYLPALKGDGGHYPEPEELPLPRGRNEHILVVDDEAAVLEAAQAALTSLGYRVTTCIDPIEALELLRADKAVDFDLLLSDYNMAKLKGTELAAAAKTIRADLPVLLATGYASKIDESAAVALGISALLMKPLRPDTLAAEIRRVLDHKPLHLGNGFANGLKIGG